MILFFVRRVWNIFIAVIFRKNWFSVKNNYCRTSRIRLFRDVKSVFFFVFGMDRRCELRHRGILHPSGNMNMERRRCDVSAVSGKMLRSVERRNVELCRRGDPYRKLARNVVFHYNSETLIQSRNNRLNVAGVIIRIVYVQKSLRLRLKPFFYATVALRFISHAVYGLKSFTRIDRFHSFIKFLRKQRLFIRNTTVAVVFKNARELSFIYTPFISINRIRYVS